MSLAAGSRLGPYEILSALGAGGMGEVYRARDTKLNRDVALKVLPESFANDPDRLARFQREAQVLASLNHPNIAHIHGLEDSGGVRALVMELVEGEDLAQRLTRGAIPIDEALPIAKQIAEALEAAHEQGIIHRDLKPANIKVTADGRVKVLDFGLAKAMEPTVSASSSASMSPTITTPAMTQAGMILGTAAYMSPEQARGKAVDQRADIWAFGVLVFEMLTGRPSFNGEDLSTTLASVLKSDPDWSALPPSTPVMLQRLLRRCLVKDPKERLQAIGDARIEIRELLRSGTAEQPTTSATFPAAMRPPVWRRPLPWGVVACALATVLLVVVSLWAPWRTAGAASVVRLETTLGADASLIPLQASLAVSPDGSTLAFAALSTQGTQQLYVRTLGELRAAPLAGTETARDPFFSPDGQWIGFFADGKLKKVAVTGGSAVPLCDAANDRGGSWGDDGFIVFQPATNGGLSRVSSSGGSPVPVTSLTDGEVTHRWPQVLQGGKAVLYTASSSTGGFEEATIVVQPLPSGAPKVLQRGGFYGRYLESGHLVYVQHATIFAAPFDLARLEPTGSPVRVIEGVSGVGGNTGFSGSAQVAWSKNGNAMYLHDSAAEQVPINWMDRNGTVTALRTAAANWRNPAFSPDGRRLAVQVAAGQEKLFTYDWARDMLTPVTFGRALDQKPVWTPDGQRLVFGSDRDATNTNLYWQRSDGSGDVQRLTESPDFQTAASWHPSGRFLGFSEARPQTGPDLMILAIDGNEASGWKPGKPTVFLSTPATEQEPMFSPDGRWIAYQSNESGRFEIYVQPFQRSGGKRKVSADGGISPAWSPTRHEILYASPDNSVMAASYAVDGDAFTPNKPRVWAARRFLPRADLAGRSFALHPDGERVALAAAPENGSAVMEDKLVFVFNFFEELRRRVPPRR